jgi:hypothetical protein
MFLIGLVYTIIVQRPDAGFVNYVYLLSFFIIITLCQIFSLSSWQTGYLLLSQQAKLCYEKPALISDGWQGWFTPHYPLKPDQMEDIKDYLKNKCGYINVR